MLGQLLMPDRCFLFFFLFSQDRDDGFSVRGACAGLDKNRTRITPSRLGRTVTKTTPAAPRVCNGRVTVGPTTNDRGGHFSFSRETSKSASRRENEKNPQGVSAQQVSSRSNCATAPSRRLFHSDSSNT